MAVPAGSASEIKTQVARPDPLVAPLTKGQQVGTLKVTLGRPAAWLDVPLVALEAVEQAGMLRPRLGCRAPLDQVTGATTRPPVSPAALTWISSSAYGH